jgi:hypothetical protein
MRRQSMAGWAIAGKATFLIGTVVAADHVAHWLGFEPCILNTLADSLSRMTGLPDGYCFGLLVLFAVYASLEIMRGVAGVLSGR